MATTERQAAYLARVPKGARDVIQAALVGKTGPSASIRAYCLMCKEGSYSDVSSCADDVCPLRHHRPFSKEAQVTINKEIQA